LSTLQNSNKVLIEKLARSKVFKDYEKAFRGGTGMPLALTPVESWGLPFHQEEKENPFCALMAKSSKTCASCLELQKQLSDESDSGPITLSCFAGLCDAAVPVKMGSQLLGFLKTGQVFVEKPTKESFNRVAKQLIQWGVDVDLKQTEEAYFNGKVLDREQFDSTVRLLKVFAEHLSIVSNQILVHEENTEAPIISRAKEFIDKNQAEELSLDTVARAVNTSTFYFCKMFKKATGLTFTDYLGRVRIEKAKNLLLNPHIRISEVAFEVGFQSLSQFNRVFKKITGQSPSQYRAKIGKGKK
jgi:AraC-like DNA-binding protein